MKRPLIASLVITAAFMGTVRAGSQELLMKEGGPFGSGKVANCGEQTVRCTPDSFDETSTTVCIRCTRFSIPLPITAQVKRIECWGTKTLPGPQSSWLADPEKSVQYVPCNQPYDGSDFDRVGQEGNAITGIFRNYSRGVDRYAKMRVYYTLPKDASGSSSPALPVLKAPETVTQVDVDPRANKIDQR